MKSFTSLFIKRNMQFGCITDWCPRKTKFASSHQVLRNAVSGRIRGSWQQTTLSWQQTDWHFLCLQGPNGRQSEEYNVCSDDTAFQCSSNQKLVPIIRQPGRVPLWVDTMFTRQVLLLLALAILWPSDALPFSPGNIVNLFGTQESDGRILQRSKRGWMWNQFFLLEEYTGNDHQYVGKVTCPE